MSYIRFENLCKNYDQKAVLKNINLEIEKGTLATLLGPSGCGKSTLLRCLAGLETVTSGKVFLDGKDITDVNPKDRGIGMVFQQYSLFPNMTVEQNIAFGLKIKKTDKKVIQEKVNDIIGIVGLKEQARQYPSQLSGGQQQRAALARAIVTEPKVLLLDEPLSAIDALLRHSLQIEIRRIQQELGITAIFVTHDQDEAMSISDFIVVMKAGVVQQIGKPQAVYDDPDNLFVAKFLGTPPINVFNGSVKGGKVYIGEEAVLSVNGVNDGEVYVGIRPEGFILDENGPLGCKLINVEVMGRDVSVVSSNPASLNPTIRSIINADAGVDHDAETVRFSVKPHKLFLFDKESEKRIRFEVK